MMARMFRFVPIAALAAAFSSGAAQEPTPASMVEVDGSNVNWSPLEIPGFASGLEIAVLSGDPGAASQPYTLRLKFPRAYKFPAHWHPMDENLTVVSGTFYLGMGAKADENVKAYQPGDYIYIPGKMSHYGGVGGETVVQLHGLGPFDVFLTETTPPPGDR